MEQDGSDVQLDPSRFGLGHDNTVYAADDVQLVRDFEATMAQEELPTVPGAATDIDVVEVEAVREFQTREMYTITARVPDAFFHADMDVDDAAARISNTMYTEYMHARPFIPAGPVYITASASFLGGAQKHARTAKSGDPKIVKHNLQSSIQAALLSVVKNMLNTSILTASNKEIGFSEMVITITMDGITTGAGMPLDEANRVRYNLFFENMRETGRAAYHVLCPVNTDNRCFYWCMEFITRALTINASTGSRKHTLQKFFSQHRERFNSAVRDGIIPEYEKMLNNYIKHGDYERCTNRIGRQWKLPSMPEAFEKNIPVTLQDVFECAVRLMRPIVTLKISDPDLPVVPAFSVMWWEMKQLVEDKDFLNRSMSQNFAEFLKIRASTKNETKKATRSMTRSIYAKTTASPPEDAAANRLCNETPLGDVDSIADMCEELNQAKFEKFFVGGKTLLLGYDEVGQHFIAFRPSSCKQAKDEVNGKTISLANFVYNTKEKDIMLYTGFENLNARTTPLCLICGRFINNNTNGSASNTVSHECLRRQCSICLKVFGTRQDFTDHMALRSAQLESGQYDVCESPAPYCGAQATHNDGRVPECCKTGHDKVCMNRPVGNSTVRLISLPESQLPPGDRETYECTQCWKTFKGTSHTCSYGRSGKSMRSCPARGCHAYHPLPERVSKISEHVPGVCRIGRKNKINGGEEQWKNTHVYAYDIETATQPDGTMIPVQISVARIHRPEVSWKIEPGSRRLIAASSPILPPSDTQEKHVEQAMHSMADTMLTFETTDEKNCMQLFLEWLLGVRNADGEWVSGTGILERESAVLWAHNGKGFDTVFVRNYALKCGYFPDSDIGHGQKIDLLVFSRERVLKNGSGKENTRSVKSRTAKFADSLSYFGKALKDLPKMLDFSCVVKDAFPHDFNTMDRQSYCGVLPDRSFWNGVGDSDWEALCAEYATTHEELSVWYGYAADLLMVTRKDVIGALQRQAAEMNTTLLSRMKAIQQDMGMGFGKRVKMPWHLRAYMDYYCRKDVEVLGVAMAVFRFATLKQFKVCPMLCSSTAASMALHVFRSNYVKGSGLPTLSRFHASFARQAYAGGRTEVFQKKLSASDHPGGLYYVDIKSLYPTVMYMDKLPTGTPTTLASFDWVRSISSSTKDVVDLTDYNSTVIDSYVAKGAINLDPFIQWCAERGYKKWWMAQDLVCEEADRKRFKNVFALMPRNWWETQEGIVCCRLRTINNDELVRKRYIPRIGFKEDGKFKFPLIGDSGRISIMTMPEFRHAMDTQTPYDVMDVYRVDTYGEGSTHLFTEYIRDLFQLKERNNKPLNLCDEELEALSKQYSAMGLRVTPEDMRHEQNNGMKALSKLLLNSLYGKFGQHTLLKSRYMTLDEYGEWLAEAINSETEFRYRIHSREIIRRNGEDTSESDVQVLVKYIDTEDQSLYSQTNVALTAYITAHARARTSIMLELLQKLGCSVSYCDTDSVVFGDPNPSRTTEELNRALNEAFMGTVPLQRMTRDQVRKVEQFSPVVMGDLLGQWESEYDPTRMEFLEGIHLLPKTYAHKLRNKVTNKLEYLVKSKGVRVKPSPTVTTLLVCPDGTEMPVQSSQDWYEAYVMLEAYPGLARIRQETDTFIARVKKRGMIGNKLTISKRTKEVAYRGATTDKRTFSESNGMSAPAMLPSIDDLFDEPPLRRWKEADACAVRGSVPLTLPQIENQGDMQIIENREGFGENVSDLFDDDIPDDVLDLIASNIEEQHADLFALPIDPEENELIEAMQYAFDHPEEQFNAFAEHV